MNDSAAWVAWRADERATVQRKISLTTLKTLAPQIAVFDFLPNPIFADAVVSGEIPIVLCLREMRDLAGYLSHAKALLQQVSLILIPHSVGTVRLPADLTAKSVFVGQVVRQSKPTTYHRREPAAPRIVISGGGGGYPGTVNFYNLAVEGMAAFGEYYPALRAELITGPLFRDWTSLRLASGIVVVPFEPDIASRFSEADLVICQTGYNTVAELETLGTKTLLVPAERQWDDQFARANRVASRHNNFHVFMERTPAELAHRAMEVLREQIPNAERAETDSGTKAAQLIYEMLG